MMWSYFYLTFTLKGEMYKYVHSPRHTTQLQGSARMLWSEERRLLDIDLELTKPHSGLGDSVFSSMKVMR